MRVPRRSLQTSAKRSSSAGIRLLYFPRNSHSPLLCRGSSIFTSFKRPLDTKSVSRTALSRLLYRRHVVGLPYREGGHRAPSIRRYLAIGPSALFMTASFFAVEVRLRFTLLRNGALTCLLGLAHYIYEDRPLSKPSPPCQFPRQTFAPPKSRSNDNRALARCRRWASHLHSSPLDRFPFAEGALLLSVVSFSSSALCRIERRHEYIRSETRKPRESSRALE